MSPQAKSLFALLATGRTVEAKPDNRGIFAELWDAGVINICPPGEHYRLNDKGRAVAVAIERVRAAA